MIAQWKLDLIDWPTTATIYKYNNIIELTNKSKVLVICQICKQPNLNTTITSMRLRAIQKIKGQTKYYPICKSCQQSRTWVENENFRQNQSITISATMKKIWQDEQYYKNQSEKHKITTTEKWKDDQYRKKVSSSVIKAHKTKVGYTAKAVSAMRKETKKRITKIKNKYITDKTYKAKISNSIKKWRQKPEIVEKFKQLHANPEYRKKLSEASKQLWTDQTYANKILINQKSKLEDHLADILDDLNVKCKRQHIIGHWPFDFMIPHSPKNILIEVHGDYWHGTKVDYNRSQDKAKATYIEKYFNNDYNLHVLWEHEFLTPQRIIDKIGLILGIHKLPFIDFKFSDCVIKETTAKDTNLLFSKYHYIASGGRSGLNIGILYKDDIVACAKFCNPTRTESAIKQNLTSQHLLELTRFVIHPSYQKKNFASWILGKAIKTIKTLKPNIKALLTFADITYGHVGTIYKASNWIHDGTIAPDYFYVDQNGYIMHKRTMWGHAKKMCMSESEYCDTYGYLKKWGKEKHRYIIWLNN